MTCPGAGSWYYKGTGKADAANNKTYEMEYGNDKKGLYYCVDDTTNIKYYFYIQGKGK